jgi:hypothetical protein
MKVLLFFSSHRQLEEITLSSLFFNRTKRLKHMADVMLFCDNDNLSREQLERVCLYESNTTIVKSKQVFDSGTPTGVSGNGIHLGLGQCFEHFLQYDYVINMVPDCYITNDEHVVRLLEEEFYSDTAFIVDHHPNHNESTATQFACDFFVFKPNKIHNLFNEIDMLKLVPPENFIYDKIVEHSIPHRRIERLGSLHWNIDSYGLIHNHDVRQIMHILATT